MRTTGQTLRFGKWPQTLSTLTQTDPDPKPNPTLARQDSRGLGIGSWQRTRPTIPCPRWRRDCARAPDGTWRCECGPRCRRHGAEALGHGRGHGHQPGICCPVRHRLAHCFDHPGPRQGASDAVEENAAADSVEACTHSNTRGAPAREPAAHSRGRGPAVEAEWLPPSRHWAGGDHDSNRTSLSESSLELTLGLAIG